MGTNYYWRHNICPCCGRHDQLHVGKSSAGFEGHFTHDDDYQPQPWITSWADWKQVLRGEKPALPDGDTAGELWDENGVHLDVEEFIAERDTLPLEQRPRQHQWMHDHIGQIGVDAARLDRIAPRCDWLDDDGWSFHGGEFS